MQRIVSVQVGALTLSLSPLEFGAPQMMGSLYLRSGLPCFTVAKNGLWGAPQGRKFSRFHGIIFLFSSYLILLLNAIRSRISWGM